MAFYPESGIFLSGGSRSEAGKAGELVLAPPFPLGGMNGNHLAFRWRASGREHAVTPHGWEPFLETVGTLRSIVRSIPEAPGSAELHASRTQAASAARGSS